MIQALYREVDVRMLESLLSGAVELAWRGLVRPMPPAAVRSLTRALFSKSWRRFQRAVADPRGAQRERLLDIVAHNRDTEFGREHNFGGIRSIADYQRRVPVHGYEDLEPRILRMTRGEKDVLAAGEVVYFARTSGTTGAAKLIPVTERFLEEYRHGRRVWARQVAQVFPGLVRGTVLTVHSPRIEGRTEGGIPYGSISVAMGTRDSAAAGSLQRIFEPLERIPVEIFFVEDFNTRYYLLLRCAVVTDISLMATVNPSTLILICHKLTEFAPRLIEDCERGVLRADLDLDPTLRSGLERRLRPDRRAADRIRNSLAAHGRVRPIDVWPELCGLLCWKGGSAPFYLRQFPEWFGDLKVMDYGYLATEGNFTVVMGAKGAKGVLSVGGHFLEFIEEQRRNETDPTVLTADQLEEGGRYHVLVTASNGLYRYDINDVIEVVGFYGATPEIAFCHKGGNMISYTGEKVGESHVVQAVSRAQERTGVRLAGFCVTVRLDAEHARYVFAVEPEGPVEDADLGSLLRACEQGLLAANIEYRAKRESLRLGDPQLAVVERGAFERWRKQRLQEGAFDSHVKVPHLDGDPSVLQRLGVSKTLDMETGR